MVACAFANLLLRYFYRRSRSARDRWRVWALGFAAINFAVGVGFGWAPVGLTIGGRLDVELLTLLVTLCVAAGAVTAFGPHLPAFLPFFLSATLPFTVASFFSSDPLLHRVAPLLMLIFIAGMGGLGIRANRAFDELAALNRLSTSIWRPVKSGRVGLAPTPCVTGFPAAVSLRINGGT